MKKQLDLLQYADTVAAQYPEISKELVMKIIEDAPKRIDTKEYKLATLEEKRLGLSSKYFSNAYRNQTEIKADIQKVGSFLYVKLDCEIKSLLEQDYICCKIEKGEEDYYQEVINLTKNTKLGFYRG